MNFRYSMRLVCLGLISLFILGSLSFAIAQGRGRGGGRSSGNSGMGGGSRGVDRGMGNGSVRSGGRPDNGPGMASDRSAGRSNNGLNRERAASENLRKADEEIHQNPGITKGMNMSANQLRSGYQSALATNPDLKFGQYVAANRIARNLGSRNPNITSDAILQGLAEGKSIGQRLQELGLSSREAKDAVSTADREIKESKRQKI
jgi:hypothetical protein